MMIKSMINDDDDLFGLCGLYLQYLSTTHIPSSGEFHINCCILWVSQVNDDMAKIVKQETPKPKTIFRKKI